MAPFYSVPLYNRLFRSILRPIFRGLFQFLSEVYVIGLEYAPPRGAYIIAVNHVSLYEPPIILAFWPVAPEAAGATDIWKRRGQATLVRLYGGIPVHRGEYDRKVVDTMLSVLRSGRPLLIAPEGGRTHTPGLQRAKPGLAYLVDLAQVPVIPVGIVGATDDFLKLALTGKRPRIEMRIGKPVSLPAVEGKGEARREARQRNADLVMRQIAALLPEEYQGVYTNGTGFHAETA